MACFNIWASWNSYFIQSWSSKSRCQIVKWNRSMEQWWCPKIKYETFSKDSPSYSPLRRTALAVDPALIETLLKKTLMIIHAAPVSEVCWQYPWTSWGICTDMSATLRVFPRRKPACKRNSDFMCSPSIPSSTRTTKRQMIIAMHYFRFLRSIEHRVPSSETDSTVTKVK